jgi:hypothetical protein
MKRREEDFLPHCAYALKLITLLCNILSFKIQLNNGINPIKQSFPTCGTHTPGGKQK